MNRICNIALLMLIAVLVVTGRSQAQTTITVTSLADNGGAGELRAAITQANTDDDGDTITFGGLSGAITLTSDLPHITAGMTIQGPGASSLAIDGAHTYSPLYINSSTGSVAISGLTIQNGSSIYNGGGVLNLGTGVFTMESCTLAGNQTVGNGNGGGGLINGYGDTAILINCTISQNSAGYEGGGFFNFGNATITGCTFSENQAQNGGAIFNIGTCAISNCTFSGNSGSNSGGGIYNSGHTAPDVGELTITNSTVSSNTAADGAGIYNEDGTLVVSTSTLSDNTATAGGGGALFNYVYSATLTNCTLSGNSATASGGAIYTTSSSATLVLTNCTITGNSGGGLYASSGTSTLTNSILYGDTVNPEIYVSSGSTVGAAYCDIHGVNTITGLTDNGGNIDANPLFAAAGLADNGGGTQTIALQNESPCLNLVPSADEPPTDQRSFARPTPKGSMGAWDEGTAPLPPAANGLDYLIAFNTPTAVTLSGSDPNVPVEPLAYFVASLPSHGILSGIAPDLTYTPDKGSHGGDTFSYTVENTAGLTSPTATVTLSIAAGAPTANSQTVTVPFNTATLVTLTASDPNVPAEALSYGLGTPPGHGSLSGSAPNWTYTPNAGFSGNDSFTFSVNNTSNLSSAPATITIHVSLPLPSITTLAPSSGVVGASVTITGTNLANASSVSFGGAATTTFTSDSATQIVLLVPAGAATGAVVVTTPGGTATSTTTFTVVAGYEGDVLNAGKVTLADWVKIGRFAAGLDPQPTGLQYQEADCAPRSGLGSGKPIGLADWVQAGRYAAGLDPLTPVGGPTAVSP